MLLKEELAQSVQEIFRDVWSARKGQVVPEYDQLKLSNDAVVFDEAVVLYADMSDSTKLVDENTPEFAAKIYKAYLLCAAKIIRAEGGDIVAYDGYRIMAVYVSGAKNTAAAKTALKLNYARLGIVNPALKEQYPNKDYQVRHVVGADSSSLLVARTGVRGANDLVWVGKAANHAAKLCTLGEDFPSNITKEVYDSMNNEAKFDGEGKNMWHEYTWNTMGRTIYRSIYQMAI